MERGFVIRFTRAERALSACRPRTCRTGCPCPHTASARRGERGAGPRCRRASGRAAPKERPGPRGAAAQPCGRGRRRGREQASLAPRSDATRPAEPSAQRRPRGPRSLTTAEAARRGGRGPRAEAVRLRPSAAVPCVARPSPHPHGAAASHCAVVSERASEAVRRAAGMSAPCCAGQVGLGAPGRRPARARRDSAAEGRSARCVPARGRRSPARIAEGT